MSVYSELLALALEEELAARAARPLSTEELASILVARRLRIQGVADSPSNSEVAHRMAEHLAYDVALLQLCASLGIEANPAMFDAPAEGRSLLHEALDARGVDVEGQASAFEGDDEYNGL